MELSFTDVNVYAGDKQILKDVCGSALPGQLLAIMGPSGNFYIKISITRDNYKYLTASLSQMIVLNMET